MNNVWFPTVIVDYLATFFYKGKRESSEECVDTEGWTNGMDCLKQGFTAEQGCTATGWSCDKYSKKIKSLNGFVQAAWCADGAPLPSFKDKAENGQWPFGKGANYPEANCCDCWKTEGIFKLAILVFLYYFIYLNFL